jgi:hypothetical protein
MSTLLLLLMFSYFLSEPINKYTLWEQPAHSIHAWSRCTIERRQASSWHWYGLFVLCFTIINALCWIVRYIYGHVSFTEYLFVVYPAAKISVLAQLNMASDMKTNSIPSGRYLGRIMFLLLQFIFWSHVTQFATYMASKSPPWSSFYSCPIGF